MKIDYCGNSHKPGVYKITNLVDGKVYIGSAKKLSVRLTQHLKSLNNNKHQNKHLQSAFNLHGTDNFNYEVLEALEDSTKEYRFQIEQEYLDEYQDNWEACYNFKRETIQKERSTFSNTPEETSKLLSAASQKMWDSLSNEDRETRINQVKQVGYSNKNKVRSQEVIDTYKIAAQERWNSNKEKMLTAVNSNLVKARTKLNYKEMAKNKRKHYSFINPEGNIVNVFGLGPWLKENKFPYICFYRLLTGKRADYKGWKINTQT